MSAALQVREIDGWAVSFAEDEEPRVRDLDLAERLKFAQSRSIRKLIDRNRTELEKYGRIHVRSTVERTSMPRGGERTEEVDEYSLNEPQAILLAIKSETDEAPKVRETLIRVFMKARRGELVPATSSGGLSIEAARELGRSIVEPILERLHEDRRHVDGRLETVEGRISKLETTIDRTYRGRRREIRTGVKDAHVRATRLFGGQCPCCSVDRVVDDLGQRTQGAEFDHFFAAQMPDVDHTWLICGRCHADFTYGRTPRDARGPEFAAYQNRRRRLPGCQPVLPGVS